MLAVLPFGAAAVWAQHRWPAALTIHALPPAAAVVVGGVLMAAGAALHGWALLRVRRAYAENRLETGGPYAAVRHPIHTAWVFLVLPGIAVCVRSWPLLTLPPLWYGSLRLFVGTEERALAARFGEAYTAYRSRAGRVFPRVRRR